MRIALYKSTTLKIMGYAFSVLSLIFAVFLIFYNEIVAKPKFPLVKMRHMPILKKHLNSIVLRKLGVVIKIKFRRITSCSLVKT